MIKINIAISIIILIIIIIAAYLYIKNRKKPNPPPVNNVCQSDKDCPVDFQCINNKCTNSEFITLIANAQNSAKILFDSLNNFATNISTSIYTTVKNFQESLPGSYDYVSGPMKSLQGNLSSYTPEAIGYVNYLLSSSCDFNNLLTCGYYAAITNINASSSIAIITSVAKLSYGLSTNITINQSMINTISSNISLVIQYMQFAATFFKTLPDYKELLQEVSNYVTYLNGFNNNIQTQIQNAMTDGRLLYNQLIG